MALSFHGILRQLCALLKVHTLQKKTQSIHVKKKEQNNCISRDKKFTQRGSHRELSVY